MGRELPPAKAALLNEIVSALKTVPNMAAIALGGSHARGTHTPESDLDIGLYYREAAPFDIDQIRAIAKRFSSRGEPTVTGFYEWGPFVNGGAWIENDVCRIDFLYRNLDQLERIVTEAQAGTWSHSFDQQPPFGFRSVTSLGEIQCCRILDDKDGALAALKRDVEIYPPKLKHRIAQDCLWLAEFTFLHGDTFARDGDVPNAVACMTRIYHYLVQALFALNETYFISDKRDLAEIAKFPRCPNEFGERISAILADTGDTPVELNSSLRKLKMLFHETVLLAEGAYTPRFDPPRSN